MEVVRRQIIVLLMSRALPCDVAFHRKKVFNNIWLTRFKANLSSASKNFICTLVASTRIFVSCCLSQVRWVLGSCRTSQSHLQEDMSEQKTDGTFAIKIPRLCLLRVLLEKSERLKLCPTTIGKQLPRATLPIPTIGREQPTCMTMVN